MVFGLFNNGEKTDSEKTRKEREEYLDEAQNHATILTDTEEEENITENFSNYGKKFANLIKYSEPHFTIGVYGEWGTGKTTLMKKIQENLNPQNNKRIITVWFNAWRYEREEQLATVALLKTITFALADHPSMNDVRQTIIRGMKIVGLDALRRISTETVMTEKGWDKLESQLTKKMQFLNRIEQDNIYFDGMKQIKEQMAAIRKQNPEYRIVVFIDDLDRCSELRALEVLESIKVFLDIEGFVYVVGLSIKTVSKMISHAYEATGIKGEDYIKKIIQIPFRIPPWNPSDIKKLISLTLPKLHAPYDKLVTNNADIITAGIEANPRELKRFVNNLVVISEILSEKNIEEGQFKEVLVLEVIKSRWNEIYVLLVSEEDFRESFLSWLRLSADDKFNIRSEISRLRDDKASLDARQTLEKLGKDFPYPLENFVKIIDEQEESFSNFVLEQDNIKDIILGIDDWERYRLAAEAVEGIREVDEERELEREEGKIRNEIDKIHSKIKEASAELSQHEDVINKESKIKGETKLGKKEWSMVTERIKELRGELNELESNLARKQRELDDVRKQRRGGGEAVYQ